MQLFVKKTHVFFFSSGYLSALHQHNRQTVSLMSVTAIQDRLFSWWGSSKPRRN